MDFYSKPRFWIVAGVLAAALLVFQQFWHWEVERIEVGPNDYLVRIHRWGKDLPEDTIVAPDASYQGVMLEVSQEGRHFLNPLFWGYELHKMVEVPPGKCLVLTRMFGREIPKERLAAGDILARDGEQEIDGERGIVREVLRPGNYRLNPYAYSWKEVPAIEIGPDQVGVRTLKVGKDPRQLPVDPGHPRYVVPDGYRGVQETPAQNGTYYLNPYVETITPVEVRRHKAELRDIEFPSRDGFLLKPHVMVEYQVRRSSAPQLLVRLTDEGILHQRDSTDAEQAQNEILQKVILPHIRGYARIEGSNFDARDFITYTAAAGAPAGNTRERLQRALVEKVRPRCQELGIDILAVSLGQMPPPEELAEQIAQRDLARVEQQRNVSRLGQYKEQQKLKAIQALKEQNRQKVEADTRLQVAKTLAEQRKQVEELRLKQELESARVRLEAARARAEAILTRGKAEAAVTTAQNEADVAGLRKAVQGFASAGQFAQYHVLSRLAPALREIFASDDSDFAQLFAAYLTPPPAAAPRPAAPLAEMPRAQEHPTTK